MALHRQPTLARAFCTLEGLLSEDPSCSDPVSTAKTTVFLANDVPKKKKALRYAVRLDDAIRLILRRHDAFAVTATHSPVVVQETLRRQIAVVRRSGMETHIGQPRIETYGESIGEITNEIFGLTADATDFHAVLLRLVNTGLPLEAIEAFFDQGLSLQARAYVMTEIARRKD